MTSGTNRVEFTQNILDDVEVEPDEKFTLTIASVSSGAVGAQASTVVTIEDNDFTVQFESTAYDVVENSQTARTIVLTATPAASLDFTVRLNYASNSTTPAPSGDTCSDNSDWDHLAVPGSVTFVDEQTRAEIQVEVCNNADTPHYDELFTLTIQPGTGYTVGEKASTTVTIKDDDHPNGLAPGTPTLTPVETGSLTPTETTLSFRVSCVSPGRGSLTNYALWAENKADPSESYTWDFPGRCTPGPHITVTIDGLPSRTNATTYRVRAQGRNLFARVGPWSDYVELATTGNASRVHNDGGEYAALIAQMYEWRDDPQWRRYRAHTARWDRALKAFGEPVSDDSLTAMTAAEAQAFADKGWTRWVEVAEALQQIERGGTQPPDQTPDPVVTVAAGDPVTEGTPAGFTLTAAPAPATDLAVTVAITQSGKVAEASALGARTVTIPAGTASAAFTVATAGDDLDEADGAIVATLRTGSGYTVGEAARAQVAVADDDVALSPIDIVTKRGIAREGSHEAVVFIVRLSRAAPGLVTVDYATADAAHAWAKTSPVVPPATAGLDYTATSGTLTFTAGETLKTVAVPLLDDAIDEGMEYFLLRFSNPQGAFLADWHRETEGLIRNDDPLQRAWLSRFGRTVATHVTDAVGDRLRGAPGQDSHVTIGGYRLPLNKRATEAAGHAGSAPAEGSTTTTVLTEVARVLGMGPGAGGAPDTPWAEQPDPRLEQGRTLDVGQTFTLRRVLMGSSFRLNLSGTDADAAHPRLTAWGRVAGTTFDGRDGKLSLDGDVLTGTVGLDGEWDRWLVGVAVAHSRGNGGYAMQVNTGQARGDLEQTLTSIHPYLRYAVTDRLDVWGLVGYGWGDWTLAQETGSTYEPDAQVVMGAFGGRGIVLAPEDTGGFQLATRTDAMLTRTSADAVPGLAATDADAHRLRLILEGSRGYTWADGRSLTPTMELGLRHDWGDAETGFGLELGGRVSYADPTLGLTIEGAVRGLLAHEDQDYQEWGASGTVRLAPGTGGQGLSLTLAPTWGAVASGVEGLWAQQTTQGLAPATRAAQTGRLAADVGYGFTPFGTGLLTPYAGTVLTDGAVRTYRLGTRWRGAPGLTLNLEGTRQEPTGQPVNQGLRLQVEWGF